MSLDLIRGERLAPVSKDAAIYTSSIESDKPLTKPVVKINTAHVLMLTKKELMDKEVAQGCLQALEAIPDEMTMDPRLEDVHLNVEAFVKKRVGESVGGQINLAKSRNDQVATAIRMVLREYLLEIANALIDLKKAILREGKGYVHAIMPGYTHLQHAQPVTLSHHLLAHHDAIARDAERLMDAYKRVNLSPMGACALATTGLAIDRGMVAELLGFDGLVENSMDAVSTRDFAIEVISHLAILMSDLSRLAEELILWSSQEFSFAEVSDEYSSTSSIMPQKKNPVVAELIRAKTSCVYGDLLASLGIVKALPYSYNLDLQELTPRLWGSCQTALSSIKVLTGMLKGVKFDAKRLSRLVGGDFSTATDLADDLVRKYHVPFRTAHRIVGVLVQKAVKEGKDLEQVVDESLETVSKRIMGMGIHISKKDLTKILNPLESVIRRGVVGGPSPDEVLRMLRERGKALKKVRKWVSEKRNSLGVADVKMRIDAQRLMGVVKK